MLLGHRMPETFVYLGQQVPKKYVAETRALGLLEEDEKMEYFYTDAFLDIKQGMYFVTDKHLVLYSEEWAEPKIIINYEDITNIAAEYDESFVQDSEVTVETTSGLNVSFPVSSEKGRDKKFVQYIRSNMQADKAVEATP